MIRLKYLPYIAGIALICLVSVQIYWIIRSARLQTYATERALKNQLDEIAKAIEEESFCQMFYSKTILNKAEDLLILKNSEADQRTIDTIDIYKIYNGKEISWLHEREYPVNGAVAIDIGIKMRFFGMNDHIRWKDTGYYGGTAPVKNIIDLNEVINFILLDSLVAEAVHSNHLQANYIIGIRQAGTDKYIYRKPVGRYFSEANRVQTLFLKGNFFKPYELVLEYPDSFISTLFSMSFILLMSLLIIILLILLFIRFLSVIASQKKLSEMKYLFINNATHELNTPITNINLALENWKMASKNADYYFAIIEEENRNMRKNVEQMLQLATIEKPFYNHQDKINIHDILTEVADMFDIQLKKANAVLKYHFHATQADVKGNTEQLKNIFHNLIDNAIKYKKHDIQIYISTYNLNNHIVVEVEDNGIGMSTETQKDIFELFYRADTGDVHTVKGFGLGLNYVKQIIEAHQGTIMVKSVLHQGTTFIIHLPQY